MIKAYLPPLAVLAAILTFTLWTGASMKSDTVRWQEQLTQAEEFARADNWPQAAEALSCGYRDWSAHQARLHIISRHDAVDDAEAMYRRATAFASTREINEFRAELADLRAQLGLLAEMERFTLKNVL